MSVAIVSSNLAHFLPTPQNSPSKQFKHDFQQLGQDLRSGNVSAAQALFTHVTKPGHGQSSSQDGTPIGPNFVFTAKLYRAFTHERGKAIDEDEKLFREGIDPLMDAGKLGAVLVQFPWSFKNEVEERNYLNQLVARFREYPLVVELRHESWNDPRVLQTLEDLGVGLCDIDQPQFADSIKPAADVTSSIGYIRLHGRNYQNWFREEASVVERYDYLYSREELDPWITRIKEVSDKAKRTFVIANNHARGQSLVNAFEILAELEEERVPGPAKLIETYPRLIESVDADDEDAQGSLF